jgi:hypothetical protein
MNNRTEIYPADLYVLLEREFKRRKGAECTACYIQLPYRVDRLDPAAPNWELVLPAACPHGCRMVIEDLMQEYGARYELAEDRRHGC